MTEAKDSGEQALAEAFAHALEARARAERLADERAASLERADRLLAERAELISRIEASPSWRLTAPLRWAKRIARRPGARFGRRDRGAAGGLAAAPRGEGPQSGARAAAGGPDALRRRPWRAGDEIPARALEIEGMITPEERRLLYWLARRYFDGAGAMIDAGSYLGASTVALAAGLRDRGDIVPPGPLIAYELFEVNEPMLKWLPRDPRIELGGSFRARFDDNVAGYEPWISLIAGDIREHPWDGGPIEVAFIDIAKSWELNDFVIANFFDQLIPGKSVLIQQDYVGEHHPWIHVTMEYFAEYFELVEMFEVGSAVYLLRESIPPARARTSITRELSAAQKLRLMDSAIERLGGERRGTLECAKASLLAYLAGERAAAAQLDYVRARYAESERILAAAGSVADVAPILKPRLDAAMRETTGFHAGG